MGEIKVKLIFILPFVLLVLAGCLNNNLDLSEEVTSIEVYEWDSEELVAIIDDKEFIDQLLKELDNARTSSTENMDIPMPDYNLMLKNNEKVLYEIGYYKEVMNFGIEGQYWEFDRLFGVKLELPID
ncbi:hypothetical protein MM300_21235 [Evansella sp. LMS18]|uniref:hypothetical protein n=1 Tax=Evansella sp. LMS18 TaxID=2924033 RepID=UPI0020D1C732|nr:hypothetical protein [Evansella sp. LMS18]UTR10363.1 hypothetical protein MM300_21235 [Evansella sp. LMS18]